MTGDTYDEALCASQGVQGETLMSLQLSDKPVKTGRERRDVVAWGIDEGARVRQDPGNEGQGPETRFVDGEFHSCPVLGFDQKFTPASPSGAACFEVGHSRHNVKRPYMSALSEMNGRPLHVRQQQFEKERHYRNMLREQIEENRRRKEAEKAKLENEKRRDLEEIRRLHNGDQPRRQQHAEFQQSPDHPMPLSARWPSVTQERVNAASSTCNGHNGTPVQGLRPAHEPSREENGACEALHMRPEAGLESYRQSSTEVEVGEDHPRYREVHDRRRSYPASAGMASRGINCGSFSPASYPAESAESVAQARGGDFPRASRDFPASAPGFDGRSPIADSVSRSDFDELTSLCRELLLEQKELRRRLDERERAGRPGEESKREQVKDDRRQGARAGGRPRPAMLASHRARSTGAGDERQRRRTRPSPALAQPSRIRREYGEHDELLRNRKVKPTVAFGSRVPRFKQAQVDEALPERDAESDQVSRANAHYPRIRATEVSGKVAHRGYLDERGLTASNSALWQERDGRHRNQAGTTQDRRADDWRAPCGDHGDVGGHPRAVPNETIHALLGRTAGTRERAASFRQPSLRDHQMSDELGGQSKFLGTRVMGSEAGELAAAEQVQSSDPGIRGHSRENGRSHGAFRGRSGPPW